MALGTVNLKEALRESLKNGTSLDLSYRKLHALPEGVFGHEDLECCVLD